MPTSVRSAQRRSGIVILLVLTLIAPGYMPFVGEVVAGASVEPGGDTSGYLQTLEPIVVQPAADSYVLEDRPSENFGTSKHLDVDAAPYAESYLRFDVSGISQPVGRVTLRLWVVNDTDEAPTVWMSPNTTWTELGVTWNNRPALDAVASIGSGEVEVDTWLEYNLSGLVRGNGTYTIALLPNSTDGIEVASRDADENQPELLIEPDPSSGTVATSADADIPVLLAAGDIAGCDWENDEQTARILDANAGIVAPLGDLAQGDGTAEEFEDCYDPTWGRHKDRSKPVPGNHEYYSDGAEPYFDYWGDRAGVAGEGWYTYELGDWQIFALNSNLDKVDAEKQLEWLEAELASSTAMCTMAYWHHPRFSSSVRHGSNENMAPFWDLFYASGMEIVLNGHDHVYERFAPQRPDQEADPEFGIRQFTVATGGAPQRDFSKPEDNSEVRMTGVHGVLRLELLEDGYTWEFIPVADEVFTDSGSGDCHEAPQLDEDGTPVGSARRALAITSATAGFVSTSRSVRHRVS